MFNRWIEDGLLAVLKEEGIGTIAFSPLAQGLLTNKYLTGIPEGSRATKPHGFLKPEGVTPEKVAKVRKLSEIAQARGQTMAQLAIVWVLRHEEMTSALIGASRPDQIDDVVGIQKNLQLSAEEVAAIEAILKA
jgi:L-glyceraldehyde 3-phosphate reductase